MATKTPTPKLKEMIEKIKGAVPGGMMKKDIAKAIGVTPQWLSEMIGLEEAGKAVPEGFLLKVTAAFEVYLTGERVVVSDSEMLLKKYGEELVALKAQVFVLKKELAGALARMNNTTISHEEANLTKSGLLQAGLQLGSTQF